VNHIGDQVETCTGQQFEVLVFGFSVGNLSLHDQLLMMNFLGCAASCKKKKTNYMVSSRVQDTFGCHFQ